MVSRGDKWVFGQVLKDVAAFVGVDLAAKPALSPQQLVDKLGIALSAAERFIRQMPDDKLGLKLPNRDRTYRVLFHHIFQIPLAFVEARRQGRELGYEALVAPPPAELQTTAAIADFGRGVQEQVKSWWEGVSERSGAEPVPTYFGEHPMREVLERTTWHSAQHVRQLMMILETHGITPDRPLTAADLEGLPLPEKVWDD